MDTWLFPFDKCLTFNSVDSVYFFDIPSVKFLFNNTSFFDLITLSLIFEFSHIFTLKIIVEVFNEPNFFGIRLFIWLSIDCGDLFFFLLRKSFSLCN